MVQNVNPTFVKTPNIGVVQITTGTGSSAIVTVYTGGVNGSKIPAFMAAGINTTGAFDVAWGVSTGSGTTFYQLSQTSIPAAAGSSNLTLSVSLFSAVPGLPLDSDGNQFLFLASTAWSLQAKTPATSSTWASGATINLTVPSVGDF